MNFEIVILIATGCLINAQVLFYDNSTAAVAGMQPKEALHSRQKRYIVFPKGSSLQLVYCNTYLLRPVVDIFRFGMTAGLAWMLPYESSNFSDKKKHKIFRRSVFHKLEALIQTRGTNGRQCILRALCESGQRTRSKKPFIKEILHRIFSIEDEDEEESVEDKVYRKAHQSDSLKYCLAEYKR